MGIRVGSRCIRCGVKFTGEIKRQWRGWGWGWDWWEFFLNHDRFCYVLLYFVWILAITCLPLLMLFWAFSIGSHLVRTFLLVGGVTGIVAMIRSRAAKSKKPSPWPGPRESNAFRYKAEGYGCYVFLASMAALLSGLLGWIVESLFF